MDSLQNYLLDLSDRLDTEGKQACADAVDSLIKTASFQKLAQYVGVIGYVLKQNRAMSNCIRKKRVASNAPMQEVIFDCLKEYQDGQSYQDTEWTSKYAQVIKNNPNDFNVSHLVLLAAVGESENIANDIEEVEKTAAILKENGIQEPMFDKLLSHLASFGDILSKDAQTNSNFKLAAPQRGWWSRLWNPTGIGNFWSPEGAWNPRTWFKGVKERGQDLDAIQELNSILTNLSALTRITQGIRTGIARLKSEANGYTSGSGHELWPGGSGGGSRRPRQESQNVIDALVSKIMKLNPDDWNRSTLLLQQMRFLLKNAQPDNQYNKQIYDRASRSIDKLFSSMEEIYKVLEAIQGDMETLRTRQPILGRELGLTENGKSNPFGITSPAEEYADLEKTLEKLYENPMNAKAQWYAQKAHARLWDKLRYIQRDEDEDTANWLNQPNELPDYSQPSPEEPVSETGIAQQPELKETPPSDNNVPGESNPIQPEQKSHEVSPEEKSDFDSLKNEKLSQLVEKARSNNGQININDLVNILNYISVILQQGSLRNEVNNLADYITDNLDRNPVSETSTGGNAFHLDDDEETPMHRPIQGTTTARSLIPLVKIADAVDEVDKDLANLLDILIEKSDKIDLIFPEFSIPVKEHAV